MRGCVEPGEGVNQGLEFNRQLLLVHIAPQYSYKEAPLLAGGPSLPAGGLLSLMPGTQPGGQSVGSILALWAPAGCGKRGPEGRYLGPWNWLLRFLGAKLLHGIIVFLLFLRHEDVFPSKV